jgi:pimeloyl-ACP methyl ester carboxylesterase
VLALVATAAVATLALPATMFAFQDRLIFFPQPILGPAPAARPGLEAVDLPVAEGVHVRGWLVRTAPAPAPLVIYFGGNAEEVSWLIEAAPRLGGWSLLLVNYRGYGRSDGSPGQAALFADALALHDWARARADVAPGRVVAMGRSLGSGVAVHLAAERPLAGVILVTPFDSLIAVGQRHYPWLPVRWLLRHPFDSLARAPAIRTPMLCLAAGRDRVIPLEHAARLRDAWAGPHRWVELPAADHDSISGEPAYWAAIAGFLASLR